MGRTPGHRIVSVALIVTAMAITVWIRTLPLGLGGVDPSDRASLTYRGGDGRDHVYLGDFDSYYWLREARQYLASGSVCDHVAGGACWDDHVRAPFGGLATYERSLHVASIVWVHRLMTWWRPGYPLAASAFLVPIIVGALGVLPAFAIGQQLAGSVGGFCAALLIAINPLFLGRSIGSDNDVWNVVLPLCVIWAAIRAASAERVLQQTGYALLGLVVLRLHAETWEGWIFTYVVALAGLFAYLLETVLRALRTARMTQGRPALRRAAVALVCFCLAPVVLKGVPGTDPRSLLRALQPVGNVFRTTQSSGGAQAQWPEAFTTVGELVRPDLSDVAAQMDGPVYFFVGWLGLLLLLLPRRRWQWWHFALLIAGNYLYAYLVTRPNPGRPFLIAVLALPLIVAVLVSALSKESAEERNRAAALLVIGWFLAALLLALDGLRFVMLLVAPFGIVFAVALGAAYEWLTEVIVERRASRWLAQAVTVPLVSAVLYLPIAHAYTAASGYVPGMNDAWWDTLTTIRRQAAPNAIVTTWWPYGFWSEYVADRRTSMDGSSLPSHVPYWIAHALFAPSEEEALGLLRMIDCGSDFHSIRSADAGAFEWIVREGVDGITAQAMVSDITRLSRDGARAYLAAHGIQGRVQERILDVTHCNPPPAYLVLSSAMIAGAPGWKFLGDWSFRNAYIVSALRDRSESQAVSQIVERFGVPEDEARVLYRRAAHLDSAAARKAFISPQEFYLTPAWVPCRMQPGRQEMTCPIRRGARTPSGMLEAFTYPAGAPAEGELRWRRPAGALAEAPGTILVAGVRHLERVTVPGATDPRLGVLVDAPRDRILVGTPDLLASLFTQLMFLDGRYTPHFRKFSDRRGYRGERVVTWTVQWPPEPGVAVEPRRGSGRSETDRAAAAAAAR